MKAEIFPKLRRTGIVTQDTENELLIYDLETNQAFCLNETSAFVYGMCDGTRSISEISGALSTKLDSNVSEEFVWLALDQLRKEKLIENEDEISGHFAGMNRREVIKKVGLGSMIALPIIASIVAPSSVHAQSCTGTGTANGGACTDSGTCASCCCNGTVCAPFMALANGSPAAAACACQNSFNVTNQMCVASV